MARPGAIGAANDVRAQERVAVVERHLPATVGRARTRKFWRDADVRRFLIIEHGLLTLDLARAQLAQRFGEDRAPGRSSINRFWKSLDEFWSKRR